MDTPRSPLSPNPPSRDDAGAQAEFLRRGRESLADTLKTGKRLNVDEVIDEMRTRMQKKLAEALQQRQSCSDRPQGCR